MDVKRVLERKGTHIFGSGEIIIFATLHALLQKIKMNLEALRLAASGPEIEGRECNALDEDDIAASEIGDDAISKGTDRCKFSALNRKGRLKVMHSNSKNLHSASLKVMLNVIQSKDTSAKEQQTKMNRRHSEQLYMSLQQGMYRKFYRLI